MVEYTFFFFTVIGDVILRIRRPDLERPFKPPIVFPLLFSIVSGFVVVRSAVFAPVQFGVFAAELVVGAAWYWGWRLWNKRRASRED